MLTVSAFIVGGAGIVFADKASLHSEMGEPAKCRLGASIAAVLMVASVTLALMGAR